VNKDNKSFKQYISAQFNRSISNKISKDKQANISRISLSIPLRPSKSILAKLKFFKKSLAIEIVNKVDNKSYTQALKGNIKDIFKIKNTFSKLFLDKISNILLQNELLTYL